MSLSSLSRKLAAANSLSPSPGRPPPPPAASLAASDLPPTAAEERSSGDGNEAFKRVSRLEGIIPALETSHALAYLEKLCPTLPDGVRVVLNCSGRGDKDVHTASKYLEV